LAFTSQGRFFMELFDNHCHLEELDRKGDLESELNAARLMGITGWLSSALCKSEMLWHKEHSIAGMIWCAGIHPYYKKSSLDDFDLLTELAASGSLHAIGEIGLDKRNPDSSRQKNILLSQLELARQYDLPVIFHVVGEYYQLAKILKDNFPDVQGCLHGFNSSLEVFDIFCNYDLCFSLNARMPEPKVIKAIIKRGLWKIETDAPYALPPSCNDKYNHLSNLIYVKDQIENIMGSVIWK
jgi:TatD DNase family protein